jgi:MFS family permease
LLPFAANLQQVYLLVFLSSLLVPVSHVVWLASLPTITGPVLYVRGYSLDIVALNVANVIGPVVGGWLVGAVGPRPTFGAVVFCLLVSTLFTMRASVPSPRPGNAEPQGLGELLRDFWSGAQFLARQPSLRYLVALNCLASFGWSATRVSSIAYVTDVLGLGGREFGLLEGMVSLSIAVGVYLLGQRFGSMSRQSLLVGGVLLAGLTYVALVFKPGFWPLLLLWFVNGLAWAAFWLTAQALFARLTPDPVRGRVFSLSDAAIYSAEAGLALVGGWLVAVWGSVAAFVTIGVCIGLGTLLLSVASSGYRALGAMGTVLSDKS